MSVKSFCQWFCGNLTRNELAEAVEIFLEILEENHENIKFKSSFREDHPNYRKYTVDDVPPLIEVPADAEPVEDWLSLLAKYRAENGKQMQPVRRHDGAFRPPDDCCCEHCGAPAEWLSINDGKKRSQVLCKICKRRSPVKRIRYQSQGRYWCPHCGKALYQWKSNDEHTSFKCGNDKCPHYISRTEQLNDREKELVVTGMGSQFKRRYQWREYHYDPASVQVEAPEGGLLKIRKSNHTLGLVLAYCISYGMSARMTARIMREVHGIPMSYKTALDWMRKAAPVAWHALDKMAGVMTDTSVAADETYIKVKGVWHYAWFVIGVTSKAVWGWNVTDNRKEISAVAVLNQTLSKRPQPENPEEIQSPLEVIGDGNPSYDAAANAINVDDDGRPLEADKLKLIRRTVIGLKNTDEESSLYRRFKQLIERFNRTYRYHTRSRSGFKELSSAQSLTTLVVADYNFLRPHKSLGNKPPIILEELKGIETIQGRWLKLLQLTG